MFLYGYVCVALLAASAAPAWAINLPLRDMKRADEIYQERLERYLETVPKAIADEARMSVPELVEYKGYPIETHQVTSVDGYILTLHRIPYGKDGNTENRPIAFLQHGVISSSADWIITGPEKALAYILADQGYDVWIGNARGNKYSRSHSYLDPDSGVDFWDFTWHQIGIYDLPAMIDYVLEQTGQEDLFYIGHSQGTTAFYVLTSEKPEYNDKIKAMFALAPIGYMKHLTSPLLKLMALMDSSVELLLGLIGWAEFLPSYDFLATVGDVLCGEDAFTQALCSNALFAVCGFNKNQMNATLLPILMGHTPSGSSVYQFLHYAQEINSGYFRKYDYGLTGNLKYYNQLTPPKYDISKVTAPVYLLYSTNDWLSHQTDVLKLYQELGNAKGKFLISDSNFNHLDYMYAIDAPKLVYNKIISLMTRH